MRRISFSVVLFVLLGAAACNKPSTDDCRKAIANMRSIHGTDSPTTNRNIESDIRSCKGGSSKEAVSCAIKATTLEELNACGFMKHKGADSAGDAAAGSDATGSGATGSGAAPNAGSAATGAGADPGAGSAATGAGADTGAGSAAAGSGDTSAGSGAVGSGSAGSAAPGSAAGGN